MKNKFLSLNLFWNQTLALLFANLKIRYRKTLAGFIWVLLNPTILLIVQTTIFSTVLKIPIKTYFPYLFSGFLPWVYISQTVDMGTSQYKSFSASIKAFNISPFVITLSLTIENFITLVVISFLYSIFSMIFFDFNFYTFIQWIFCYIPLMLTVFSITFSISILYSKIKDIKYITTFLLSILYFISPIFYSIELIKPEQRIFFKLNPFYHLILPFQNAALNTPVLVWFESLLIALLLSFLFFILSHLIWKINKKNIYNYL